MKNNGIEDIMIDNNYNSNKKKGKKGIIIIFILLLILLIGLVFGYWYFTRPTTTAKELFFTHLSNSNIKQIISKNTYKEVFNKLQIEDFKIDANINFTSTLENENLEGLDVSKFILNLNTNSDIDEKETYSELGINYSGNEVLKVKMLSNEDSLAIISDEIVNKYVGIRNNSIENTLGIKNNFNEFLEKENIELTDEKKDELLNKYIQLVFENTSEEKYKVQDNYVLDDSKSMNVVAYTLNLNQEELKNIIRKFLTQIKNEDELLKQLIKTPQNSIISTNEENSDKPIDNQKDNQVLEENKENLDNLENKNQNEENLVEEENSTIETNESEKLESGSSINLMPVSKENNIEKQETSIYEDVLNVLLGKKIEIELENLKQKIDELINQVDKLEGNGLVINIYVSENGTEKINIILPNESTFDIDLKNQTDEQKDIKLTYLYKGNNNIFEFLEEKNKENYTAEDLLQDNMNINKDTNKSNGYSLEINKIQKDASNDLKLTVSFIENEEINKKIILDTKIEGTSNSKNLKVDSVLTISTDQGETKTMLDGNIQFKKIDSLEETITQENTLFLDDLSKEEYDITVKAIQDKILQVYNEKKEKFNFIDTNISDSIIQQNLDNSSISEERENVKKILENKIQEMKNEAEANQVEFTIQNLNDLTLEGYEISKTISEENAVFVIDIYTFNIDKEFNVLETE